MNDKETAKLMAAAKCAAVEVVFAIAGQDRAYSALLLDDLASELQEEARKDRAAAKTKRGGMR